MATDDVTYLVSNLYFWDQKPILDDIRNANK